MRITLLDRAAIGEDTPLSCLEGLGELKVYEKTEKGERIAHIGDAEILVLNKVRIDREVIEAAKSLRLICVFATGFDNIDLVSAREHGIAVCNVPAYSTDSVALFTLANVLYLFSHLGEYREYVASGAYSASGTPNRLVPVYHELAGKTWGIVGYGNIGRAVGKAAKALGAEILVCKRTPVEGENCVDLETLCKRSDIISLHCPLNDSTRGMIGKDMLKMMKNEVVLVNEARGAVLDEAAVADAVLNGEIGAFGSDVYAEEPFPKDHPYAKIAVLPNVCLTPHAAWGSIEARSRCISVIADNIAAYLRGERKNRVD